MNIIKFKVITCIFSVLSMAAVNAYACDAPLNSFCVDYYKSRDFSGLVAITASESTIDHNWGSGSPNASIPVDNFSGRWRGRFNFAGGDFIFHLLADDGSRLYLDGKLIVDGWKYQTTEFTATTPVPAGEHLIEVEYYEAWGSARLTANWEPVRTCDVPVGQFCVAYFDNRSLAGNPKFIDHEAAISHLWGVGSPTPSLPADNFSGRWQGDFDFEPGTYSFTANTDDGMRLYVDGQALIGNAWLTQGVTLYEKNIWLTGRHRITVEYFDALGTAVLQVGWTLTAPITSTSKIGDNATSPLGTNLSDWKDWTTEQPFIDVFKTSRSWIPQAPGIWDTGEQQSLNLDANGWVRTLPAANDTTVKYRSVSTLLLSGQDLVGVRQGGEYVVLYEGEGKLTYGYAATKIAALSSPGRDVINVDKYNSTGIQITIASTDPNKNGNYIRNIRVIPPGVVCDDDALAFCPASNDPACNRNACRSLEAASSTRLFHPLFLKNLVSFRALRFMNPQSTNVISTNLAQQVDWANRNTLNASRWNSQAGIPIEIAIALSNQIKADPWLNMPHRASDDYIRQFARLARQTLDSNRKVYIEYGNEIWNTNFWAGYWVEQQGLAAWPKAPDSAYTKRINWYGKRVAEMCDIWKAEWAGEENRVVCVLAAQAANVWTGKAALNCSLWEQAPCQSHGITAVAISPSFGYYIGSLDTMSDVVSWTKDTDGGLNRLFDELSTGGQLTGGPVGGALAMSAQWMANYADLASTRGLSLLAYESGQHLSGIGTTMQDNQAITNLFVAANRDPRMAEIYTRALNDWRNAGGGLLMNFFTVGQYGKFGSWGALENMWQQSSPKFDALTQYILANPQ